MIDDRGGGRPFSWCHQMGKKIFIGRKNIMSPVLSNASNHNDLAKLRRCVRWGGWAVAQYGCQHMYDPIKMERSNWPTKHPLFPKLHRERTSPLPSSNICLQNTEKISKDFAQVHKSIVKLSLTQRLQDKGVDSEKREVEQVCWRDI